MLSRYIHYCQHGYIESHVLLDILQLAAERGYWLDLSFSMAAKEPSGIN
jgi:hypothetical protein